MVIEGPSIQICSGRYFDFADVRRSVAYVSAAEMAYGLANICRFAGHTSRFYSVAEHTVLVYQLCVSHPCLGKHQSGRLALFHDAHEALVGDVPAPMKPLLPDYRRLEDEVSAAVLDVFVGRIAPEQKAEVKRADLMALAIERRELMPDTGEIWPVLDGIDNVEAWSTPQMGRLHARDLLTQLMEHWS